MVLDNRIGASSNDFQLVKRFATDIVDRLSVGPNNNRIALVTIDNGGTRRFDLDDYSSGADIKNAINVLQATTGSLRISDGLRAARQQVFNSFSGDRSSVKNVVILLSRGNDGGATLSEIDQLKAQGTAVVAVGLRGAADENLLRFIVTSPSSTNYVSIGSLSELPVLVQTVTERACAAVQQPGVVTPAPTPAPTVAPTPAPNPARKWLQ